MKRFVRSVFVAVLFFALAGLTPAVLGAEKEVDAVGSKAFQEHKCNLCHAVPAAAIEAKTKSEKMLGPAFSGELPEVAFGDLAAYLRKRSARAGVEHKREFKVSDEELQAILDWLAELAPPRDEESDGSGGRP